MGKKKRPRVPGTRVRTLPPHKQMCVLVGDKTDPVIAVRYDERKVHSRDSGYMLFTSSAPHTPDETDEDDYLSSCLACMSDGHPEAERGLVLARAYGFAYWDEEEGAWIAEDDDGNEVLFDSGDEPEPNR